MTSNARVNPFGEAKPREAVLASKGVDYRAIDSKLDEKAGHGDDAAEMYQPRHHQRQPQRQHHNEYHPHHHHRRGEYHPQSVACATSSHSGGRGGGGGRLTPSQAIHPAPPAHRHCYSHYSQYSPRGHRYSFDKDDDAFNDDDYMHETASVTTIHSHDLSHHTCTPHSSPSANPFGDARPREEVLADKCIDAKEMDTKIDQQVLEKEVAIHTENLVALNHPGEEPAKFTSTSTFATTSAQSSTKKKKKKINPFGDAKPREVVLANKGVDYRTVDKILDRKIAAEHLTPEQDAEAEVIRLALTQAEDAYWDANEKELPEEELRLDMEAKRKELHDLLEKFQEINLKKKREGSSSSPSTSTSTSTSTDEADNQGDDEEELGKDGSSTRAEPSKEKKGSADNETTREGTNDEKVEYHFQGRTDEYHDRKATYQRKDRSSSNRPSSSPRNQGQSRNEYHGGDARRYSNVERPWYASRNRYADGDESRSGYTYSGNEGRGGAYYRGGRGRGGRGRRYGEPDGRYSGRGGRAGYGGHSRSHERRFDDNDEYDRSSQKREHWALMD